MLQEKEWIELALLGLIAAVIILAVAHLGAMEVDFSRKVFSALANGNGGARKLIDWENFQAFGADLGATYRALPDATERANYEQAFIRAFSLNFKKSGGRMVYFKRWRRQKEDARIVVVAADEQRYNKTALFFLCRYPQRKLCALAWQEEGVK
jgi:hypothetical protein